LSAVENLPDKSGSDGRIFHRDLDMVTPSLPLSRSLDLPVCLDRFPWARLWLKDESLEDSADLPDPDIIAAEIVEDLQAALAQFAEIASDSENAVHTAHSQLCSPKAH
jgi:hypothetical protein